MQNYAVLENYISQCKLISLAFKTWGGMSLLYVNRYKRFLFRAKLSPRGPGLLVTRELAEVNPPEETSWSPQLVSSTSFLQSGCLFLSEFYRLS